MKLTNKNGLKRTGSLVMLISLIFLLIFSTGCSQPATPEVPSEQPSTETPAEALPLEGQTLILSTTTSTQDSGLLDFILPDFKAKTGAEVKVVAVGSGAAIQMGVDGEADVLLVHAKADEEKFVAEGHGLKRYAVMYNDFVVVGPSDDPAGLKGATFANAGEALAQILDNDASFVSRGDDSGTHKKENSLWKLVNITPEGSAYVSAGKGMGDVLQMASELEAYTLTDRATYLSMKDNLELEIVTEGLEGLLNPYGVIAVNPEKSNLINAEAAQAFIEWIISDETQALIGEYGVDKYGAPLFFPDAE
jgi:tungstate transport system substrate-binding protein